MVKIEVPKHLEDVKIPFFINFDTLFSPGRYWILRLVVEKIKQKKSLFVGQKSYPEELLSILKAL